ncbi:MAG TPA: hypothetical protein VN661_12490 [Candidatus Acidoferrales bacterium]|nr:hypothetical protein [Candidatus Acidoferrales bacterium]
MGRTSCALILALFAAAAFAPAAPAQNGSIQFVVRATPSGGIEEPVRGFPLYLLNKSFAQITQEVSADSPTPRLDAFIDGLNLSPQLKSWMKKNHSVKLSGPDFLHKLKPGDVMDVPEFYRAYMEGAAGEVAMDFPKPKYKPSDEKKNPEKYRKLVAAYREAIRHYVEQYPQTRIGMEVGLADSDPETKWNELRSRSARENQRLALNLAESKYLVAKADTNLQGEAVLQGIPPGAYWLSSLDLAATIGDVRPRWDVPVQVRPGQNSYIALSNVNAVPPSRGAQ